MGEIDCTEIRKQWQYSAEWENSLFFPGQEHSERYFDFFRRGWYIQQFTGFPCIVPQSLITSQHILVILRWFRSFVTLRKTLVNMCYPGAPLQGCLTWVIQSFCKQGYTWRLCMWSNSIRGVRRKCKGFSTNLRLYFKIFSIASFNLYLIRLQNIFEGLPHIKKKMWPSVCVYASKMGRCCSYS